MAKTHWRHEFDSPTLGHWDLEKDGNYQQFNVTIEKIYKGEIVGQEGKTMKTLIKFKEFVKPMVCNITNFKRLERRFSSTKKDDYLGGLITLGVEKTKSPEGKVDCLRFLSKTPTPTVNAKKSITDERLQSACDKIQTGDYSKEDLLKQFDLTPDQITKLDSI